MYAYGDDSVNREKHGAGGIGGSCWGHALEVVTGVGAAPKRRVCLGEERGRFRRRKGGEDWAQEHDAGVRVGVGASLRGFLAVFCWRKRQKGQGHQLRVNLGKVVLEV